MISRAGLHRRSSHRAPIQTNPDLGPIPTDPYGPIDLLRKSDSRSCAEHMCLSSPGAALFWLNARGHFCFRINGLHHLQVTEPAVYPDFFLFAKDLEVIIRDGQRSVTGAAGAAHRPRRCVLRVARGPAEGSTGSSRERRSPSSVLPSRSHPEQPRPRPIPDGPV